MISQKEVKISQTFSKRKSISVGFSFASFDFQWCTAAYWYQLLTIVTGRDIQDEQTISRTKKSIQRLELIHWKHSKTCNIVFANSGNCF